MTRADVLNVLRSMRRSTIDDIGPTLPVLETHNGGRRYVWPTPRHLANDAFPAGSLFYTEGDCWTCSRCGVGNSTIAAYCKKCRALLPLGSLNREAERSVDA